MSSDIFGRIIAVCDAGLRYVIKGAGKLVPTNSPPTALAKARPNVRHRANVERGVIAETATIVCAMLVAVALGVASGLWINTGIASPPLEDPPAPVQSPPGLHAAEQTPPMPTTQPRNQPDDSNVPSQEAAQAASDEPSSAGAKNAHLDEAAGGVGGGKRAGGADEETSNTRDEAASVKADEAPGRPPVGEAKMMVGRGRGKVGPCTLLTDARALTIRSGGSATITLRLNGATGSASINAATPNWSDIVVFAGAQTFGNGVSVRWYTIRSVSKRAGNYRVSFSTPCGSKTIPVTVTQP